MTPLTASSFVASPSFPGLSQRPFTSYQEISFTTKLVTKVFAKMNTRSRSQAYIDDHDHTGRYPFKRLIVCCDGTWQASNQGTRSVPSNVAKLSRSIKPHGPAGTDGKGLCPQITYYDAGVGTAMGKLEKTYAGLYLRVFLTSAEKVAWY